jgi:short-subunit dehydrogenase
MTTRLPKYHFAGGTAVVTGAASGIGKALAHDLAARGSNLVLVDRDARRLADVVAAVRAANPALDVGSHVVDLSDTSAARRLGETLLTECTRITLLVNNAGIALGGRFDQVTLEEFDTVMRVNFQAPLVLTHTLLPALKASPGSHLVNVSSLFGLIGPAGQSAYAASKFALRGLTEVLRHELPAVGVGVTAVHPGGVRTRIAASARVGSGVPVAEALRHRREFQRLLTIDPAEAARVILDGIEHRRTRVLVGWSAKVPDIVARLFPASYGSVLSALQAANARCRAAAATPAWRRRPAGDRRERRTH